MLHRRAIVVLLAVFVSACGTKAPPPPLKPNAFNRLGVLPILEHKASGDIAPLSPAAANKRKVTPVSPLAYNPMTLGLAIGSGLRASRDSQYNSMSDATSALELNVLEVFATEFNRSLAADLPLEPLADDGLASRLRNDDYKQLPSSLDGIVDIQIYNVGYYDLGRGRGYAPFISIYGRVFDLANPGEVADEWDCKADAGAPDASDKELSFPANLVLKTLPELRQNPALIKAEFTRLLGVCGRRLAAAVNSFQQAKRSLR